MNMAPLNPFGCVEEPCQVCPKTTNRQHENLIKGMFRKRKKTSNLCAYCKMALKMRIQEKSTLKQQERTEKRSPMDRN
jgi:hypothetical protein